MMQAWKQLVVELCVGRCTESGIERFLERSADA